MPKKPINIRISEEAREQLRELCAITGNSEGVAIERAIAAMLDLERARQDTPFTWDGTNWRRNEARKDGER